MRNMYRAEMIVDLSVNVADSRLESEFKKIKDEFVNVFVLETRELLGNVCGFDLDGADETGIDVEVVVSGRVYHDYYAATRLDPEEEDIEGIIDYGKEDFILMLALAIKNVLGIDAKDSIVCDRLEIRD